MRKTILLVGFVCLLLLPSVFAEEIISIGKTTTAEYDNAAAACGDPDNATNGDLNDIYLSCQGWTSDNDQWWKVDLASEENFQRIDMKDSNGASGITWAYLVEGSNNDADWTTISDNQSPQVNFDTNGTLWEGDETYRYVRLRMTGTSSPSNGIELYEFMVVQQAVPESLSLNHPADATTIPFATPRVDFNFTPTFVGQDKDFCELYTNETSWSVKGNISGADLVNDSQNNITYTFPARGDFKWTINCVGTSNNITTDNRTFSMVGSNLTINATAMINSSLVENFDVYVNGTLNGSTTNGTYHLDDLLVEKYYITIEATDYNPNSENITIANLTQTTTFVMVTLNNLNITFYDEVDYSIASGVKITAEFISDNYNYSLVTTDGTMQADLFKPDRYTLRYYTNATYGDRYRYYIFDLANQSTDAYEFFLISNPDLNVTVTTYEATTLNKLKDAVVYVQRRFNDNVYRTVAMGQTDSSASIYIELDEATEFYKFIVDSPFETQRLVTSGQPIESTQVNLLVDTIGGLADDYFASKDITYTLVFDNTTDEFSLTYADTANIATEYCLELKKYVQYGQEVVNSSCSTSNSGSLAVGGLTESITYYGVFSVTQGGEERIIASIWESIVSDKLNAGSMGVFMTGVLVVTFAFLSVIHVLALILATFGLVFAKLLGLVALGWGTVMLPVVVGIILAVFIEARK